MSIHPALSGAAPAGVTVDRVFRFLPQLESVPRNGCFRMEGKLHWPDFDRTIDDLRSEETCQLATLQYLKFIVV